MTSVLGSFSQQMTINDIRDFVSEICLSQTEILSACKWIPCISSGMSSLERPESVAYRRRI